jgi:hypothetical protein
MPRPFDNVSVQKEFFENWMKTTDWDRLEPAMQHSALLYYQALLSLEQKQAMEAAIQQQQMAEQLGMGNASKPRGHRTYPRRTSRTTKARRAHRVNSLSRCSRCWCSPRPSGGRLPPASRRSPEPTFRLR